MSHHESAIRIFNRVWFSRITLKSKSDCGANADGGGGFQAGNSCGGKDGAGGAGSGESGGSKPGEGVARKIDIPLYKPSHQDVQESKSIKPPEQPNQITGYLNAIKNTKIHIKVHEMLTVAEKSTITGDVRYASIEMNIKCCPDENDIKKGKVEYVDKRIELHDKIVETMLPSDTKAKAGKHPVAVLLIGPPGAGKSSAGTPIIDSFGVKFAVINNDEVKSALPEYKGWNAAMVHEESAMIVEDMVIPKAIYEQHNMVVDGVGNSEKKMLALAKRLHDNDYDINLVHVTIPTEKTVARAWDRFSNAASEDSTDGPGRYVPLDYIAKVIDQNPTKTYEALRDSGLVDSWSSHSNDVPRGSKPKLLDKGDKSERRKG